MTRTITDKIDNITGMREDQYTPIPPCPKSVKIELTARCNFACSFCATANKLREKGDMDIDFYVGQLLPMLREAGVEEVGMFYLGESFLLPWLPDAIAEAKRQGFPYVFITTNGSAAEPDMVKACMEAGLDSLKFSLNYADEKQFSEIARVKPALFDVMMDNIWNAARIRDEGNYDCGVFASYINYDGEQGEKMKVIVDSLTDVLDEIYALPLYSQADLVGDKETEAGWDVKAGNPGRAGEMRSPIPCWSIFTEARVTYDGHLSACCFDHDGRFRMGDLNEQPFMEAWHSDGFKLLREAHLKGELEGTACEQCVAYG